MKTLFTILIILFAMQATTEKRNEQVIEVVIYKVKQGYEGNLKSAIDQARSAVYGMPGFVSYKTFRSRDKELIYMDHVIWESIGEAKSAAAKVPQLKEFTDFGEAIEDIVVMDHLQFYH